MLFECLTGRPPFMAEHVVAILTKVLFDEPPRPSELRRDVPPMVDALVARLMAKDRARRLSTAHASILRDAHRIRDDELRSSFLNNVPEHARILELARAWAVRAS